MEKATELGILVSKVFEGLNRLNIFNLVSDLELLPNDDGSGIVVEIFGRQKEGADNVKIKNFYDRILITGKETDDRQNIFVSNVVGCVNIGTEIRGNSIRQTVINVNGTMKGIVQCGATLGGNIIPNPVGHSSSLKVRIKVPKDIKINIGGISGKIEIRDVHNCPVKVTVSKTATITNTSDLHLKVEARGYTKVGKISGSTRVYVADGGFVSIGYIDGSLSAETEDEGRLEIKDGRLDSTDITAAQKSSVEYGGTAVSAELYSFDSGGIIFGEVTGKLYKRIAGNGTIVVHNKN